MITATYQRMQVEWRHSTAMHAIELTRQGRHGGDRKVLISTDK